MAADVLVEDFLPEDSLYWKILYWKVLLWMILLWMILCFLTSRTISGKRLRFFRRKYYFRKTKRMLFYHQIFWTLSINAPSQPSSRDVWTRPSGQCNSIPTLFPDSKATFFPAVCKLSSWLADEGADEKFALKNVETGFSSSKSESLTSNWRGLCDCTVGISKPADSTKFAHSVYTVV